MKANTVCYRRQTLFPAHLPYTFLVGAASGTSCGISCTPGRNEEASERIPKTPLTLSLLLPLLGNQAGANVEVYNHREELREELPWAEWLLENKAQVMVQEWPNANNQLLLEETALFKTHKETGEKTQSGLTCFYGMPPALTCHNHTAPQEPHLCPFLVTE